MHPEHVGAGRDLERKGTFANMVADDDPAMREFYPRDLIFVVQEIGRRSSVAGRWSWGHSFLRRDSPNDRRPTTDDRSRRGGRPLDGRRRVPFDSIRGGGDEYLLTIVGATHSTPSEDETPQNGRTKASAWLSGGGLKKFVADSATVERK